MWGANKNSGSCGGFCYFNMTPEHNPTTLFGVPIVESSRFQLTRKKCSIGTSRELIYKTPYIVFFRLLIVYILSPASNYEFLEWTARIRQSDYKYR